MKRIRIIVAFLLLCIGFTVFAQEKPNIVMILIDDMGWKDVSYMGSEYYETPNIDSMAKSGTR